MMDPKELRQLIEGGETFTVEFKGYASSASRKPTDSSCG